MKKIILLLLALSTLAFAKLEWGIDYDGAIKQAKAESKKVLVMLSREGCPTCEYMKDIVFENGKVVLELKKGYHLVMIDIHNDFVPTNLSYYGTPTFYILDGNEKKLDRIDGGVNTKTFLEHLEKLK